MTTKPKPRSPHALIRAIESNVKAYIDGGRPRERFEAIAEELWAEGALDPAVYADLTAYFMNVTLARGTPEALSEDLEQEAGWIERDANDWLGSIPPTGVSEQEADRIAATARAAIEETESLRMGARFLRAREATR